MAFSYSRVGITAVIAHESPCQEAGDGVADIPPYGQESDEPGVCARQKLQEVCRVKDVIAARTSGVKADPVLSSDLQIKILIMTLLTWCRMRCNLACFQQEGRKWRRRRGWY